MSELPTMKRYMAFLEQVYYPCVAMEGCIGDFNSLDEAIVALDAALEKRNEGRYSGDPYGMVFDQEKRVYCYGNGRWNYLYEHPCTFKFEEPVEKDPTR